MKTIAIIPAYNEGKNITEVIKRAKKFVEETLVIDDGSTDRTFELAKKAGSTVIRHKKNKGKGEALKTAIRYLKNKKFDYAIVIDADLQLYPEDTPKLISKLKQSCDLVMGDRNIFKLPFRHFLGNFVWRTVFNLFFGTKLKDTNCGLIAFKKSSIKKLKFVGGYIIETTLLASAVKNGLKICNVPVRIKYHSLSGVRRGIRVVLGVFISIIKEGIRYRLGI